MPTTNTNSRDDILGEVLRLITEQVKEKQKKGDESPRPSDAYIRRAKQIQALVDEFGGEWLSAPQKRAQKSTN